MNTTNFFRFLVILHLLSFTACNNRKVENEESKTNLEEKNEVETTAYRIDNGIRENLISSYLELKDALVETNPEAAAEAAGKLAKYSLESDVEQLRNIHNAAIKIGNSRDPEVQRKSFEDLSEHMYELVKETGSNENTLYKQYCPMAFDNKGAYWLSAEKKIMNPYFGDEMLHCGKVEETLD